MKLSLATSTVLLCATAVQAFIPGLDKTPSPGNYTESGRVRRITNPGPLKTRAEGSGPVAGPTIGDIEDQISALIQAAKVPEDIEEIRQGLVETRNAIIEQLLQAHEERYQAELHLSTEQTKAHEAEQESNRLFMILNDLKGEKYDLEAHIENTQVDFDEANKIDFELGTNAGIAMETNHAAIDKVKELREAVDKVDEAIKNLGVIEN